MRHLLVAAALCLITLASPAFAGPCALDHSVIDGDVAFVPCPFGDTDDFLLDHGFNSARLPTDVTLDQTPIFVHGICRYVDSRGLQNDLFIPFNSPTEWSAFLSAATPGVHIAECCVPRAMKVDDIPEPTEICSTGWHLDGLADPADTTKLLALPNADGTLSLAAGVTENPDYPILALPIERDDVGALLPAQAQTAYIGRWVCTGTVSGEGNGSTTATSTSSSSFHFSFSSSSSSSNSSSSSSSTSSGPTPKSTSTGTTTAASGDTNTHFVGFAMQCVNNDWRHTSPSCVGRTIGITTEACPNGATGSIVKANIRECDGTTSTQIIENTCSQGQTCPPKTVTQDCHACPEGQTGQICEEVTKLCFSQKPVSTESTTPSNCRCTTKEKEISNTCLSCPPSTDLGNTTHSCPEGQSGSIVVNKKRICIVGTICEPGHGCHQVCDCHEEETVVSNTCQATCVPSTDLGNETRACPAGQEGQIVVHKTRLCHPSCQCGGSQCVCHDEETVVSNTCHVVCPPSTDLGKETRACPPGQVGEIVVQKTRLCQVSCGQCEAQQCICHDEETICSNTCVPCPPDTDLGVIIQACPTGQTGQITIHTHKICVISNNQCVCHDEQTVTNTCVNTCTPSEHTTTQPCPPGFSGIITITTRHLCPDQDVTTTTNTCTPVICCGGDTPTDDTSDDTGDDTGEGGPGGGTGGGPGGGTGSGDGTDSGDSSGSGDSGGDGGGGDGGGGY